MRESGVAYAPSRVAPPDAPLDPFGRRAAESSPTFASGSGTPPPPARPARSHRRARVAGRLLAVVALLAAGGAAVAATMRHAVDTGASQSRALAFALASDPLGPRSLLRPAELRRALDDAAPDVRTDERVAGLTAGPERLLLTLIGDGGARRWLRIGVSGDRHETSLPSATGDEPGVRLGELRPEPALRALARRLQQLGPAAREPTATLAITTRTSVSLGSDLAMRTATSRQLRWVLTVQGVPAADRSITVDARGRVLR